MESNDEQTETQDERDDYCIALRFFGDDLDPDEVTRVLGLAPTIAERRGDTRRWRTGSRILRQGSWRFATQNSTTDIEQQCIALFDRLTTDLLIWQSLTNRFQADVFCGVFFGRRAGVLNFSPRLHQLLADRNLTLILDMYGSDEPTENA